jgi:Flp pilus assembly protein CpaB
MARKRTGGILMVLGVLIAAVCFLLVWNMAQRAQAQRPETVQVVVALADIPERVPIQASQIGVKELPREAIPPGAIFRPEDVVNRLAIQRIYQGEMLVNNRISDTKGASGIAFAIDPGKVIITLPASDIVTTGALKVGDSVDLLVTLDINRTTSFGTAPVVVERNVVQDTRSNMVTQVTLQNLQILAIGQVIPEATGNRNNNQSGGMQTGPQRGTQLVTFAVSPQDALVLKFIKDFPENRAEIVLRAAGDEQIYQTEGIDIRYVLDRYRIRVP